MAIKTSGPISLSDIAAEFGGSAPHSLSEYRGEAGTLPYFGPISIGEFYGASSVYESDEPASSWEQVSPFGPSFGTINRNYSVGTYGFSVGDEFAIGYTPHPKGRYFEFSTPSGGTPPTNSTFVGRCVFTHTPMDVSNPNYKIEWGLQVSGKWFFEKIQLTSTSGWSRQTDRNTLQSPNKVTMEVIEPLDGKARVKVTFTKTGNIITPTQTQEEIYLQTWGSTFRPMWNIYGSRRKERQYFQDYYYFYGRLTFVRGYIRY